MRARLIRAGLLYGLLAVAAVAAYYLFPYNLAFLTRTVIMMIFVLSIDLVLGVAGVSTLGQAAMYGTGAYAAGLFAIHVSRDPLLGLGAGAVAGMAVAFVSGLFLMRARGLTLLMLTIAVAQVLQEIANKARDLTGGADGLSGIRMGKLLGIWKFDFVGKTGYIYAVCVLFVLLILARMLLASPFGLAARGIHESPARMRAIGAPVYRRLVTLYTISGAVAGIAGALAAQITALVSLEAYSFTLSAEAVIMLILGGTGRLIGALLGPAVFMSVQQVASSVDPYNWLFIIGALVLAVVFFVPSGLLGLPQLLRRLLQRRRG